MLASVKAFLEDESNEERSVHDVAKLIVDAFYDGWSMGVLDALPLPSVGIAYRTPLTSKVYHVCWTDEEWVWLTTGEGGAGVLVRYRDRFWQTCKVSVSKPVNLSNKDWKAGDTATRSQRMARFDIVATNVKGVLLRQHGQSELWAESNADMAQFYRKEAPKNDLFD